MVREGLKLLKALGGNDKVKVNIIQAGGAPLITTLLALHKSNSGIAKLALGCIATLSLRVQENGIAFFDAGAAEVIVETMKIHPQNKEVVRNAAWSIRNMVARSKDKADLFLSAVRFMVNLFCKSLFKSCVFRALRIVSMMRLRIIRRSSRIPSQPCGIWELK